MGELNTLS